MSGAGGGTGQKARMIQLVLMLLVGIGLGRLFWGSGRRDGVDAHAGRAARTRVDDAGVAPAGAEIAEAAPAALPPPVADVTRAVRVEPLQEPSVPLDRAHLIGTVADVGGRPIEGATIRVVELMNVRLFDTRPPDAAALAAAPSASGISDSEGRFSIEHDLKWIAIEVAKEGYGALLVERHPATFGQVSRFDFTLSIAEPLAGLVVDSSGRGIPSASLTARSLDPKHRPLVWAGNADSIGAFALPGLTRGDYLIEVQSPGFVTLEARLPSGRTDHRLVLTRSGVLTGRVRADGGPDQARMQVTLVPQPPDSGAVLVRDAALQDRSFRVEGLAAGEYDVIATIEKLTPVRAGRVVIEPGKETDLPSIAFGAGYEVRGVILDAEGKPMAGVSAIARLPEAPSHVATLRRTAKSAQDGSYSLTGLPAGPILIRARGEDHICVESVRLDVLARREASIAPDLIMERFARVRGRTVDATGRAMTGVVVILNHRTSELRAVSDKEGRFNFDDVIPGEVSLVAATFSGGRRSETFRCRMAGGSHEEIDLTLR